MMKMSNKINGVNFQDDPSLMIFSRDKDDVKKHVSMHITRYGLVSSEIKISFDRTAVCVLDIIDALSEKRVRNIMEEEGLCGNAFPIKLTEAERIALYDHKHDEIFDENQNDDDNERRKTKNEN